jgi:hypothetical protein
MNLPVVAAEVTRRIEIRTHKPNPPANERRACVAQVGNLPYRRLAVGGTAD